MSWAAWFQQLGRAPERATCQGCEARDRHIEFLQTEVRLMRDQVVGFAHKTMVMSSEPPAEAPILADEDAAMREAIEQENLQAEAEARALASATGRSPEFLQDVPP